MHKGRWSEGIPVTEVHLIEAASKFTIFNTHEGKLQFKRIPSGVKMSQDVFLIKMGNIMELCPGVISFNDHTVIYSVDRNMMPISSAFQT